MSFCTAINCMDGRTQLPVIDFLRNRFNVQYVDSVTEPGPIVFLSEQKDSQTVNSILHRVDISVNKHKSKGIAIVAHYDCAGNPVEKDQQLKQLASSVKYISEKYPTAAVIGLWVDENWAVSEV